MATASKSKYSGKKTDPLIIVLALALGALSGYALHSMSGQYSGTGQLIGPVCAEINYTCSSGRSGTPIYETLESSVTINLPAVDANGNGATMPLTVQKRTGNGETLIDINNLVFWFDTQQSIQTAKNVAEKIAAMDTGNVNLVYIVNTGAGLVGGPSAGAALTIATIAAIKDEQINSSVMITGTINPDGSIGQVGGILEKAKAAKGAGAKLFLVPEGQSTETTYDPRQVCTTRYGFNYCRTQYYQNTINVSENAGIEVKEVSKISDAMPYFGVY